jgi:hypothetical protein
MELLVDLIEKCFLTRAEDPKALIVEMLKASSGNLNDDEKKKFNKLEDKLIALERENIMLKEKQQHCLNDSCNVEKIESTKDVSIKQVKAQHCTSKGKTTTSHDSDQSSRSLPAVRTRGSDRQSAKTAKKSFKQLQDSHQI